MDHFIVSARKYRPSTFVSVIGQASITTTLKNAILRKHLAQAYLFCGPRGVGKTTCARIFAKTINCLNLTADTEPCNECESCKSFNENRSLNIHELDAASNNSVEDIRTLIDKVRIPPQIGRYSVYIIDEVHMLSNAAFNAFLKTLEEPPEHVVFILATTEVHKLPATIVSRTQRHSFKAIPEDQVVKHLKSIAKKEKIEIDDEALKLLARHGNGSFRDSISLLDQLSSQQGKVTAETVELFLGVAPSNQLADLLDAIVSGGTGRVITTIGSLLNSGLTPSGIANQLAVHIRDQIVAGKNMPLVTLLGELLTVHGATNQQLTLETILLRAAVQNTDAATPAVAKAPSAQTISTPQKTAKVSEVKAEQKSEKQKPKASFDKPLPAGFAIQENWAKILATIKAKNNPLYTVLRLAHPSVAEGSLTIAFAFEFHQKRADDAKHKAIIADCLQEATSYSAVVETRLDKSLGSPEPVVIERPSPPTDPAHASVIAGIRDIMGGGEVVNV